MTLQEAAKTAIDVQDACNLSGVVGSFSRILSEVIWPEARRQNQGTDWVNRHPIALLFASKIEDLTRVNYDTMNFSRAYDACKALAAGEAPPVAPHTCKFCGAPSYVEPEDQTAPADYCHPSDHGAE